MRVWVDIDSGTWGVEDDDNPSIYTLDHTEWSDEDMDRIAAMPDDTRISWAKTWGIPLRMLGCKHQDTERG